MPSRQASTKTKASSHPKAPNSAPSYSSDPSVLGDVTGHTSTSSNTFKFHLKLDHLIEAILLLTVGLTPLIFSPLTSELFEFPKMIWVYSLAIVGLVLLTVRSILQQRFDVPRTPLTTPLAIYLLVFLLATLLSVDLYTSIAGYYTRFNGGLASLVAYLILAHLTLIHLATDPNSQARNLKVQRLIWAWLAGATITSIWAIAEHFGHDPSCLILRGTWDANCWVQDVQARVFSTFGQPNWLATYLLTCLPLGLVLILSQAQRRWRYVALAITAICFAAWWYTYSRSAWFGLIAAAGVLVCCLPWNTWKQRWVELMLLAVICLVVMATGWQSAASRSATSLESGSNDSSTGQIRLLVWQGSLNLIKEYPLIGSGPETFAYTFLPHRPADLNQTTEWNFLYNKAHNEILQTAATTGILGLIAWLSLIGSLIVYLWRRGIFANLNHLSRLSYLGFLSKGVDISATPDFEFQTSHFISAALLAGLIGVFVSQLLGFSVVTTSLLFWLSLAILVAPTVSFRAVSLYSNPRLISFAILSLVGIFFCSYMLIRYASAEVTHTQANSSPRQAEAVSLHQQATLLNPLEPTYWQQLAYAQASLALSQTGDIRTELTRQAVQSAQQAERLNPHNQIVLKGLVSVYQQLMLIDSKYQTEALRLAQAAWDLAPTDAGAVQVLADLQLAAGHRDAITAYNQLIELRPVSDNYLRRARYWQKFGTVEQYRADLEQVLKLDPRNEEAQNLIHQIN